MSLLLFVVQQLSLSIDIICSFSAQNMNMKKTDVEIFTFQRLNLQPIFSFLFLNGTNNQLSEYIINLHKIN